MQDNDDEPLKMGCDDRHVFMLFEQLKRQAIMI